MSPRRTSIWVGLILLLFGAAIAVFVRCPTPAQAYAIVVLGAIGAGTMLYGLLGVFQLSGTIKGIISAGGGTVLLLLFFFTPGAMEALRCPDFVLLVHVCEECPASPVEKADVFIVGGTQTVKQTNDLGEARMPFGASRVGEDVQIWAEQGDRRTTYRRERLRATSIIRVSLPLPKAEGGDVQVPTVTYSEDAKTPPTVRSMLADLKAGARLNPDDLLAAGVAAYNAEDYEATVKLFEATRQAEPLGGWFSDAPYLAAAYARLGDQAASRRTIAEIETAMAQSEGEPALQFLDLNAERASAGLTGEAAADLRKLSRRGTEEAAGN